MGEGGQRRSATDLSRHGRSSPGQCSLNVRGMVGEGGQRRSATDLSRHGRSSPGQCSLNVRGGWGREGSRGGWVDSDTQRQISLAIVALVLVSAHSCMSSLSSFHFRCLTVK